MDEIFLFIYLYLFGGTHLQVRPVEGVFCENLQDPQSKILATPMFPLLWLFALLHVIGLEVVPGTAAARAAAAVKLSSRYQSLS